MVMVHGLPLEHVPALDFHLLALRQLRAEPSSILIRSAVRSPMSRSCSRLTCCVMASSMALPAADRLAVDDAGERDDGDVGRAAADVHDHVAGGFGDRQPGANRRGHRFLDEVHFAGLRAIGAVLHRTALDLRDLGRTPMTTRGRTKLLRRWAFLMK